MTARPQPALLAFAALAAVVVALVLILTGGESYVVKAQFINASQLVKGNTVEVAGRRVGLVQDIGLAENGLAEVTLELDDDDLAPLHEGTRAAVRSIGLSGVANRFVDLAPGPPSTPEIPDGGVLPPSQTRGVVDLDALLNSFTPEVRSDVQGIVREAAVALTPRTAEQANAGLEMLNPAFSRLTELGTQLTADEAALRTLLPRAASLAKVLAQRREAVGRTLDASAEVFTSLAAERDALADMLERAPATMRRASATLQRVRTRTLPAVDPLLAAARPAVGPLADVIRRVEPTLRDSEPLIARLRELVPAARAALEPLPGLEKAAVPAIASVTKGLGDALPMISGLRPYTPELVAGFFTGFGGSTAQSYDANGHYARVFLVGGAGSFPGLVADPPEGALDGYRTGLDARCPGAAEEPHPDGSNPWVEGANADGRDTCDPKDNR